MAGGSPDEGEGRRGRREPTDADVQREWAEITAGLADLGGLGDGLRDESEDGSRAETDGNSPGDSGHSKGETGDDSPGGSDDTGDDDPTRAPAGPPGAGSTGHSPSSPGPGEDSEQDRQPPSSAFSGPPRIGDLPRSSPGAGAAGPRDYDLPEDEDEGYTPPEPPPIGATDPLPTLAWLMALGGPIFTVLLLIFWTTAPGWVYLSAVAASVAGWLVLFWRMPRGRRDSDDDNGAVL